MTPKLFVAVQVTLFNPKYKSSYFVTLSPVVLLIQFTVPLDGPNVAVYILSVATVSSSTTLVPEFIEIVGFSVSIFVTCVDFVILLVPSDALATIVIFSVIVNGPSYLIYVVPPSILYSCINAPL